LARRLGAFLITDAMERVPDIGFGSYDRLFPSQDTMPAGGFGNLIALPLQGGARSCGNSVFVDESCSPYPDQWAFLSAIGPMPRAKVERLVEEASASGKILGVRIPRGTVLISNSASWRSWAQPNHFVEAQYCACILVLPCSTGQG
jgi:hypothetical protein